MSELFEDVAGARVKAIVDDLLIWGKDDDEHDARQKQVLNRAREVNLKFNAKKCRIRREEVPYVGHVLSKEGLKPDPEKIRAVQQMQPPQNTKELKHSLDLSSIWQSSCKTWLLKELLESCLALGSRARN